MKENFKKLFVKHDVVEEKNTIQEISEPKKDVQYDLFNMPGESLFKENNRLKTSSDFQKFYQINSTELSKKLVFEKLKNQNLISLNIEDDSENNQIKLLSFSWGNHKSYFTQITNNSEKEKLRSILNNKNLIVIGYDLKSQFKKLNDFGISFDGICFDNKIAHYLVNPDLNHDFKTLCESYLNYTPNIDNEDLKFLSMEKSDLNYQLYNFLISDLKKGGLEDLFKKIEMPLLKVLSTMELNGIKLDSEFLKELSNNFHKELKELEKSIFKLSNQDFNLASPKQLGEVLFGQMKIIENPKKTKSGQYSTSEEVLSKLAEEHVIVEKVLEWRSLQKLLNTYVDALPKQVDTTTERIHAEFNQAVASTGRLSSNNPNLQNIPIRNPRGREVRKAFICENENYVMISADYSQIELRVIAALSEDPNMISAFNKNLDIHSSTAAKVFNVKLEDVTKEQRSNAKTVNFGIIYGVSAFGLSNQTSLTRSESKLLIESYYDAYPKLKNYISSQINFARENGYVETILGRKRYLRDINSRNAIVRGAAERNAVNAPVQGSAADIIKIAMIKIHEKFQESNFKSKMLVQVHDELVFEVHKKELEQVKKIIKIEMEQAYSFCVPLKVDMDQGLNWFEAH